MILPNFTWPFDTSQPSQRLPCILNKCHYKNQHTYTSNSLLMSILFLVFYKKILSFQLLIDFIIIHSINFDYFLSINIILYKDKKQGILYHYMLLWA